MARLRRAQDGGAVLADPEPQHLRPPASFGLSALDSRVFPSFLDRLAPYPGTEDDGSLGLVSADARDLLPLVGPTALELLSGLPETRREQVTLALSFIAQALQALDDLDLSPYEMDETEDASLRAWRDLGPRARALLDLMRTSDTRLATILAEKYESIPPPDAESRLEAAFFGEKEASALRIVRTDRAADFDRAMEAFGELEELSLEESVETLLDMLRPDFKAFARVLSEERVQTDRWFLLAELHDFRSTCTQCLEAVVVTILNSFSPVSVVPVLPRYRSAAARAVTLRTGIIDLAHDVTRFNDAIKQASELEASILRTGLIGILDSFARSPAYPLLRPSDKKETILFRLALAAWAKGQIDLYTARHHAEDFARFLEVMRSINRRESLRDFDAQRLTEATEALAQGSRPEVVLDGLQPVYGRSEELDELLRIRRITGAKPDPERLASIIDTALATMMMI